MPKNTATLQNVHPLTSIHLESTCGHTGCYIRPPSKLKCTDHECEPDTIATEKRVNVKEGKSTVMSALSKLQLPVVPPCVLLSHLSATLYLSPRRC
jgi:hypothetical protein